MFATETLIAHGNVDRSRGRNRIVIRGKGSGSVSAADRIGIRSGFRTVPAKLAQAPPRFAQETRLFLGAFCWKNQPIVAQSSELVCPRTDCAAALLATAVGMADPAAPHRRRLRALHAQLRRPGTGSASPSRAEAAASAYADDSLRADPHGKVHFVEVEPNVLLCANIYRPTNSDVHPVPVVLAPRIASRP